MQSLIETLIYLLAIMGIIFTSMSFIEICNYKNYSCYNVFNKGRDKNKKVEIIINLKNMDEEEENKVVDRILKGEYKDIKEFVDCVRVEKDN